MNKVYIVYSTLSINALCRTLDLRQNLEMCAEPAKPLEKKRKEKKQQNANLYIIPLDVNLSMFYLPLLQLLQRFRLEYHHEALEPCQRMVNLPDKPVKVKFVDRL